MVFLCFLLATVHISKIVQTLMAKLQEDNRLHQDRKKSLISRHSRQQARFHL
jgi:hypothetical protein